MNKKDMVLTDLLDLNYLQEIQDSFARVTGITTVLTDYTGCPLTRPSNAHGFCAHMNSTPQGARLCQETNRKLCSETGRTRAPFTMVCPHTGLLTATVPLILDDVHLGNWILRQTFLDSMDENQILKAVVENGVDQAKAASLLNSMTRISRQKFEDIFSFFTALTDTLIELARANFDMVENNQHLIELTEQLDSTAQMLTKFTNSADVGMYVTDFFTGEILQANEQYARYLGTTVDDLIGVQCWKGMDSTLDAFCPDCPHDRLLDETGHPGRPIVWERYSPDQDSWVRLTNQAIYWVDGRLAHMVTFIDITQIKQMQTQLARLAYYDRAMQLPNALKLMQDLADSDNNAGVCLISFDILSLRTINDMYSRETGDRLLREISHWIQQTCEDGVLYRIEGDEFCLVIRRMDQESAHSLARHIYARFDDQWVVSINGESVHIFCGITMGIIHSAQHGLPSGDNLLNLIERTLATARLTRDIVYYDDEMDRAYREQLLLELSLKNCVRENMTGFAVHYQPIIDPVSGMWCSLEALCRWNSPELGPVPPLVFIHKAEQLGLIGAIGRWVMEQALYQCKKWKLDRLEGFILDVNLSPVQINDEMLVPHVLGLLKRYDFPGEKLSLEVTESTEVVFSVHTRNVIDRLREANIKVALDDFGTGYSSFNNLKQLPVSFLKTEREFLENIENDSYLQHLVYVMAELAHAADMKLIAEGVETEEQVQILLRSGVDYFQGYLFGKPMSPEVLEHKLEYFHRSISMPGRTTGHRVDLSTAREQVDSLSVSPVLMELLNRCMRQLLTDDTEQAISDVLSRVGTHFSVDRSYVFRINRDGKFSRRYEWCAPGILPFGALPIERKLTEVSGWTELLRDQSMIVTGDIRTLPADYRGHLAQLGIRSIAIIPFWQDRQLMGFVGFDSCTTRNWQSAEVLMLHNLCSVIASRLQQLDHVNLQIQEKKILSNALRHMSIPVMLYDQKTNELLFTNRPEQERSIWNPAGMRYSEDAHGRQICYNTANRHQYLIYHDTINQEPGRPVRLEYFIDITESDPVAEPLSI